MMSKEKNQKLENLRNLQCSDNDMKKCFDKLIDLAKEYDMRDFVMNKLTLG